MVLAYPSPQDRTNEISAWDSFREALKDPDLFVQVQAQKQPDLASAFRIAQRMEANFKSMQSRARKLVRVVMEDPAGAVIRVEARDPLVEQLAKAIQQLNQRLLQAIAKDSELGPQR